MSSYTLDVAGIGVIDHVPLDLRPIRWEEMGPDGVGRLTFTVEDEGGIALPDGADVRLTDATTGIPLFGGILLERRVNRGPGGIRWTECDVVSYDWYLDHRIVPRHRFKRNDRGRIRRILNDRNVVKDLIATRGGPLTAPDATVDSTETNMPLIELKGETLRSALEKVGDEAGGGRHFYVDADRQLHYFQGKERLQAPHRVADGSYVRDVIETPGLVEYWSLREEAGMTVYGSEGVANLALEGATLPSVLAGGAVGVVNEPMYRALTFTSGARATVNPAPTALLPGNTFSLECWFRRADSGRNTILIRAGSSAYELRFDTADTIRLRRRPSSTDWVSSATYPDTTFWHHLVVAHASGSTDVYLDGVSISGTTTSQVFGSGGGFSIGHTSGSFAGDIQHVAVYDVKLSAAVALAHYQQGRSITPENLELSYDSTEDVHQVYVRGPDGQGVRLGERGLGAGPDLRRRTWRADVRTEKPTWSRLPGSAREGDERVVLDPRAWRMAGRAARRDQRCRPRA